ncbi:UNVERIFIED_CONTAM: hypothetical protein FKN15_024855, partial [Acipenser sinensis]
ELCEILGPFEEATDKCQGDQVVTTSYVIACVRGLRHAVAHMRETYNSKFVVTMQSSLEKHIAMFEDMECFQMAVTLDPRFKLDWCMGEEVNSIRELLTNKVFSLSPKVDAMTRDSTSPPPKKRIKLFSYMTTYSTPTPPSTTASDELTNYLSQPCLSEDANPLAYWKENQNKFPILA